MRELTPDECRQYHAENGDARILRRVLYITNQAGEQLAHSLVVIRDRWGWYVEVLSTLPRIEAAWVVSFGHRFGDETDVLGPLVEGRSIEDVDRVLQGIGFTRIV